MSEIQTQASNRRIGQIIAAVRDEKLIPRPEFQRRLVWSNKHKSSFIETILLGYPFPEIYIAVGEMNTATAESVEMLVDGQQRVTTIYEYFTSSPSFRLYNIPPYSSLSKEEKENYLSYSVVVRDIGSIDIDIVKQIFQRINSTKYSLNAMEIHNARYDGELKDFADKLSTAEFFEKHRIFNTTDIRRMHDVRFVINLIIAILEAYPNRDDQIEEYLRDYNDSFSPGEELASKIEAAFTLIDKCNLSPGLRVWKKVDIYNLIVEMVRLGDKIVGNIEIGDLSQGLTEFYESIDSVDQPLDEEFALGFAEYRRACIQATNDRTSRATRGRVLKHYLGRRLQLG